MSLGRDNSQYEELQTTKTSSTSHRWLCSSHLLFWVFAILLKARRAPESHKILTVKCRGAVGLDQQAEVAGDKAGLVRLASVVQEADHHADFTGGQTKWSCFAAAAAASFWLLQFFLGGFIWRYPVGTFGAGLYSSPSPVCPN